MATLERKKTYVAEQQRQLASMIEDAENYPPPKRLRVSNASITKPVVANAAPPWKRYFVC